MIRPISSRGILLGLVIVLGAAAAPGCTVIEKQQAKSTEQLLAASGFAIRPADTPEKLASLRAMKQRKLIRHETPGGKLEFLWADALVCRCIYVGDQQAYQAYESLAVQQQIAESDREAALDASMDSPWGYDWWGMPYPY